MKRQLRQSMEAEGVPGEVRERLHELLNTYDLQIRGLEQRVAGLEEEIAVKDRDKSDMKESLDELLSLQKLSEAIRSALSAEGVIEALIHLTQKILPVESCGVFLVDMRDFQAMNAVYQRVFGDHRPARTTVGVAALPAQGLRVEIDAVAYVPERE